MSCELCEEVRSHIKRRIQENDAFIERMREEKGASNQDCRDMVATETAALAEVLEILEGV